MTPLASLASSGIRRVAIATSNTDTRAVINRLLRFSSTPESTTQQLELTDVELDPIAVRLFVEDLAPDCLVVDATAVAPALAILTALSEPDGNRFCPIVVLVDDSSTTECDALLRSGAHEYVRQASISSDLRHAIESAALRWRVHCRSDALNSKRRMREESEAANTDAKFKFFFDQGPHFASLLTLDGTVLESNHLALDACGFRAVDVIGLPFWQGGWWNRSPELMEFIRSACFTAASGQPCKSETPYFFADGSERFIELSLAPVRDGAGQVMFVASTGIDITDRKRAVQDLLRREEEFRTLADNMSQFAWMANAEGWIYWYNSRWFEYTGTTLEQMQGWGWKSVHHPQHVDRVVVKLSGCFETGAPWEDLFPLRGKDGQFRWFLSRALPIRDPSGAIVRWLGTNTDVTAQRNAEELLRAREQELGTLADNTPDILARFDRNFRHVFINTAGEQTLGRPRSAILLRSSRQLGLPNELCDLWEAALCQVFSSGQHKSFEFSSTYAGANLRHYSARLVPEFDPAGSVQFVLAVTHDQTERKLFEQTLAEQDKRKDEFIATLAHELRNPLAPIRSGLGVVRLSQSPEQRHRALDMMDRQLAQLVHLVDDLLDISRINQGKIDLRTERVDLREIVSSSVEACQPTLQAKAQTLNIQLPQVALAIVGDKTRLVQVVANLLNNAAKYSPHAACIEVLAAADGAHAIIKVSDVGEGIAPDALPTIWDMFTQVRATLDQAQGGLGIGLSLVRKLVAMHGGSVTAQSDGLGKGSSFTVRIPMAAESVQSTLPHPSLSSPNPPWGADNSSHRVLVVDDNVDNAEMLAMLLQQSGYTTKTAHSGSEALRAVPVFTPHAVFVDIGLPDMDGFDVARHLRADAKNEPLLLIALTGWGSAEDQRKSKDAGFDLHLTKPASAQQVHDALSRLDEHKLAAHPDTN